MTKPTIASRRVRLAVASAVLLFGVSPRAVLGTTTITTCGTYNGTDLALGNDLTVATLNADCLVLTNPGPGTAPLEFNGFTITCTNATACGAAVRRGVGAGNFHAQDTAVDADSGIKGKWTYGIKDGSVDGIRIDGSTYGVYETSACGGACAVLHNVIVNCGTGIYHADSGNVIDNYIVASTTYAADVSAASGVAFDSNYVRGYGTAGVRMTSSGDGVENIVDRATPAPSAVPGMQFVGAGTPPPASWSTVTNICEDTTWCARKTPSFVLP